MYRLYYVIIAGVIAKDQSRTREDSAASARYLTNGAREENYTRANAR